MSRGRMRWSFGLLAMLTIAAVSIFGGWGSLPLQSLSQAKPATEVEARNKTFPASHAVPWNKMSPEVVKLARPYGVLPASLAPLDQIGEGVFTEEQLRVY